ncbi:uncharacterized protein HRG_02133 [Hirsutella rhossiliensis]|uniref:Uncharacterized protein n=1 Tax=Hirsutella rhossiliensis TaxID=111463 RepID=A0A9P8SLW9_9HYPO|nr:uncharacterized protein HRG_02133 [Hirsutella rhossiliensis]KAH0966724.1 hypothetical protein HRG_02133 [Hirsutella rhossiliensis]
MTRLDKAQRENPQGSAPFRDRNKQTSSENSLLAQGDGYLRPLLSLSTGEVIEHFPSRAEDVASLSSAQVNRILVELKLDTDGSLKRRRRRLLLACGVTHPVL